MFQDLGFSWDLMRDWDSNPVAQQVCGPKVVTSETRGSSEGFPRGTKVYSRQFEEKCKH